MATYPTAPRADFLAWANAHVQVFDDQEANIGLTAAQVLAFRTALTAAQASETALTNAKDIAAGATVENNGKFVALRKAASTCVRSIRTFAENNNNPNVYTLAQIPPPADPSEVPPPAKPVNMTVSLDASNGAITLKWKASNPKGSTGTSYIIYRRLPANPQGEFQFVGVSGEKKFTDNTFTAGPDAVQYVIQGQRSDKAGPLSDVFTVTFGRNTLGQTRAFVAGGEGQAMKLAA